jgi:hypothetical protein
LLLKSNSDGKFTTFIGLNIRYCHSCGKTGLPPTLLKTKTEMNLYGMIFKVNEPNTSTLQSYCSPVAGTTKHIAKDIKYIQSAIWDYHTIPENNLLQYLQKHIAMTK